jgi:hypothetical protein
LGGGTIGSINFHCSSVRSLGYPFLFMEGFIGQTGTFHTRSQLRGGQQAGSLNGSARRGVDVTAGGEKIFAVSSFFCLTECMC